MTWRARTRGRFALWLAVALALPATSGAAVASARGPHSGPIVFSAGKPTSRALWSITGSGKHPRQITSGHNDYQPSVAPNGRRVVFVRNSANGDQLYIANISGGAARRLTKGFGEDFDPAFSPNGRTIAFSRDGGIATMTPAGENVTYLTAGFGPSGQPVFTPDGQRIFFVSNKSGNLELYSMSPNGTDFKQITDDAAADFDIAVSPNGQRIAFASDRSGRFQIYTANLDGSGLRQLTHGAASERPSYSPDGRQICFVRNGRLFAISAGGRHPRLVWGRQQVSGPTWGPVSSQTGLTLASIR